MGEPAYIVGFRIKNGTFPGHIQMLLVDIKVKPFASTS